MKTIKPVKLKEARILSNEEMKTLFGGSAAPTVTCTVSCSNDTILMAYNCISCSVISGGAVCVKSNGDTSVLKCQEDKKDPCCGPSGKIDCGCSGCTCGS